MAREAGVKSVTYRHDRRLIGVSVEADLYEIITRISKDLRISRAALLHEGAEIIAARYALPEGEE